MKSKVKVNSGRDGVYQRVQARERSRLSDEPIDIGGSDSGPTPFALLLESLGSGKAITIRLYTLSKRWNVDQTVISLDDEQVDKHIQSEFDSRIVLEDVIIKSIEIKGEIDEFQKTKLLELAQKYLVHKMLAEGGLIVGATAN